ncbi:protein NLRC3-like [Chanos chanos]|uniref:Protein NLRC3-like n=1 Tax=Chanos chanos TaxID=29144 RepID=A0A6J2VU89_CHACN|nr:protein NLRC3-like [Chanos chanos]
MHRYHCLVLLLVFLLGGEAQDGPTESDNQVPPPGKLWYTIFIIAGIVLFVVIVMVITLYVIKRRVSPEPAPPKTPPLSSDTQHRCGLCERVLTDPVSSRCGHSFCRQCISKYWDQTSSSEDNACPLCRVNPRRHAGLNQYKESISAVDVVLQRTVECHKTALKKKHEHLFEGIKREGNQTVLNSIYTQLYITEGESEGVENDHEIIKIETASRRQTSQDTPISCNDIFKPLTTQEPRGDREVNEIRTVLTKGIAGIGKTVSVQKFVLDWADGKANQDVDFLIVLPFRELNIVRDKQYSLHGLVLEFHPELRELDPNKYDDCKMVFIFDGLDESRIQLDFSHTLSDVKMSSSVDILTSNLIKGNLLPSALVWITSRPAAVNQIPSQFLSRVTEIQGFSDSQKEEYFKKRVSDQNQASKIISHIKTSRSLHIMCHIPVFCWISATVLQKMLNQDNDKEIPKTLTEMYIYLLLIQTNTKNQKYEEKVESNPKDLLEANKEIFLKLAELAFKQLLRGNITFYEGDLKECGIDVSEAIVYSGICTEIFKEEAVLHQKKVYSFVHLSVQEFFAALHIFHSYMTKNMEVLHEFLEEKSIGRPQFFFLDKLLKGAVDRALKCKTGRLDLFLRFLFGISLESNQKILQGLLPHTEDSSWNLQNSSKYIKQLDREDITPERCINLLHCLSEMNDYSIRKEIQDFLKSKNYATKLSLAHCTALVSMLLKTEEVLDEFDLKKYGTSEEGRRRLIPAVRCCRKALFAGCKINVQSCEIIATAMQSVNSPLRELDLSDNDLQDSGVRLLSAGLASPHCTLEILRLSGCLITGEGCFSLASALSSNPSHLRELDLSYNHLGESGVKMLSDSLKNPHCRLEKLNVDHGGEIRMKPGQGKYTCELTLDPNTAHTSLSLSEGNRTVKRGRRQSYPDHPERFQFLEQALCKESLSGRCYWEVEWAGEGARVGVTYKGINRKGEKRDCVLGLNDKSWCLYCTENCYYAWHDNIRTRINAVKPFGRVGVYLGCTAGILSFYSMCPDTSTQTHVHTFHTKFTEPLYPGFWLSTDSSVSLCEIK